MHKSTKALLGLNLATFLFGFVGVFAKSITWSASLIIWGRSVVASVVLLLVILLFNHSLKFKTKKEYLFVFLLGILMFLHWITFFHAMKISTVAVGMISMFTFPIFTVFIEPILMKEKLKFIDVISGFIVFLGVVLLVPELSLENSMTQGVLFGVLSALLYAFRNVLTKKHFSKYSSVSVMFYQVLTAAICLLPLLFKSEVEFVSGDLWMIALLGIFFTALPHTLLVNSLAYLKAKTMSIITSSQPIYAIIFAAIFLNEIPDLRTIIGGVLIVGAVIFETLRNSHDSVPPAEV